MEFRNKIEKGKNLENPLPLAFRPNRPILPTPALLLLCRWQLGPPYRWHLARPLSPLLLVAGPTLSMPPHSPTRPIPLSTRWAPPANSSVRASATATYGPHPLAAINPTTTSPAPHTCTSRWWPTLHPLAKLPLPTPSRTPVHAHPVPAASLLSLEPPSPELPSPRARRCSLAKLLTPGISHGEAARPSLLTVVRHRHQKLLPG
jgi:hypothetical protein